jgi:hypothetical protein
MDGTSNSTLLEEKDPRTTGEYSTTPSGTISEKDFVAETTLKTQEHKMAANEPVNEPAKAIASNGGKTPAGAAETETVTAAGLPAASNAGNQAHDELAFPVLPGWRFGLLGLG